MTAVGTTIKRNSIINNLNNGIYCSQYHITTFTENNLFNNLEYDFYHNGTDDQIAHNNYWGTINSFEIMENIYDYWDEITFGKVILEPFATKPFTTLILKGDVDGNVNVELEDAILAIQVLNGSNPSGVKKGADVNGDGKIGNEDVIYILQKISKLRN